MPTNFGLPFIFLIGLSTPTPADFAEFRAAPTVAPSALLRNCRPPHRVQSVNNLNLRVMLCTPVNSAVAAPGDPVEALVSENNSEDVLRLLDPGTRLSGCVTGVVRAKRMSENAKLSVEFYKVENRAGSFPLRLKVTGASLPTQPVAPPSAKERAREFLMLSARLAIPLALGSAGTSVAITAGAGAVVGCVLADNGKHLVGAVRGAWEGSGLAVFDPLIAKGTEAILPCGTELTLQAAGASDIFVPTEPQKPILSVKADLARPAPKAEFNDQQREATEERKTLLVAMARYYEDRNLAQALGAADKAIDLYPNDTEIQDIHSRLFKYATTGDGELELQQALRAYAQLELR